MATLSYTQEFYLCAINGKGKIPPLRSNAPCALLAGGVMELISHGNIHCDEKGKYKAAGEWDDALHYLKPLYDSIAAFKRPPSLSNLVDALVMGSSKIFNAFFTAVGLSLVEISCAEESVTKGLLREKIKYIPKEEAVQRVIEKVRVELLGESEISDETLCLMALLYKNDMLRSYFSKAETPIMKKRVKEMQKSEACALILDFIAQHEAAEAAIMVVVLST